MAALKGYNIVAYRCTILAGRYVIGVHKIDIGS